LIPIGLLALMVLTSKGAAGITGAGVVTLTASLLDEEKFHEALRSPAKVERATDRPLAGATA
jgi:hypothetical protein